MLITVLTSGDLGKAKKLLRLLLADPLSDEGEWEKSLDRPNVANTGSSLYTFGEETIQAQSPSNRLLPVTQIPSRTLNKHKIEVLISTLNVESTSSAAENADRTEEAVLAPALDTPTSSTGRFTQVTYPVHRALVLGQGVDSVLKFGRLFGDIGSEDFQQGSIKLAIQSPGTNATSNQNGGSFVATVDIDTATQALQSFRESISNATLYEQGWIRSGMPLLSDWFIQGTKASISDGPKKAVITLTRSLLREARRKVDEENAELANSQSAVAIPATTRNSISIAISNWAEKAHAELRDQLEFAFAGKHWRKLAWWKLLWRVDDVGMVTAEVLERRWLLDAEKGVIYLAGRVEEAGLGNAGLSTIAATPSIPLPAPSSVTEEAEKPVFLEDTPPANLGTLIRDDLKAVDDGTQAVPVAKPWPMTIPFTRHRLMTTTVPALQSLSQRLVLQVFGTNALASSIAAIAYLNVSTTTMYETGAIAALGLAFSLRKLQGDWEKARAAWQDEVREEGRTALKETEETMRRLVQEGGLPGIDEIDEDRMVARRTIEKVEISLDELESGTSETATRT